MCIRDRVITAVHIPLQKIGHRSAYEKFKNPANGYPIVGVAASLVPVSYTHLRAHETVLDLVCRLLLEKNKKTNNTIKLMSNHA